VLFWISVLFLYYHYHHYYYIIFAMKKETKNLNDSGKTEWPAANTAGGRP